ncbi:MAG: hypothetical protein ACK53Y_12420, partial [bacterium]
AEFQQSSFSPSYSFLDDTCQSTPILYTSPSAYLPPIPIPKPNKYTSKPLIQSGTRDTLHKPSKQPNSRLLTTTWASTESILPQFPPTKTIRTLEGIPFWKIKQNSNFTTKTNINSKKSNVPQNSSKKTKKSRNIIQRRKNRYIKKEIKNYTMKLQTEYNKKINSSSHSSASMLIPKAANALTFTTRCRN